MTTQVIRGSNQQIAEVVAHMPGRVLEAILLVDEGALESSNLSDAEFEKLIGEMESHSVSVGGADYSRESIYSRQEGE